MMTRFTEHSILKVFPLLIVCCSGTEIQTPYYECTEIVGPVTLSVDELSQWGFSAQDVLDAIELDWEEEITIRQDENIQANYPLENTTWMTVKTLYEGGEVSETYLNETDTDCNRLLKIDVEIRVRTSCGLLDEEWPGSLYVDPDWEEDDSSSNIRLVAEFDQSSFNGNFEITGYSGVAVNEVFGVFETTPAPGPHGNITIHLVGSNTYTTSIIFYWNTGF